MSDPNVQIIFTFEQEDGTTFRDAINMPLAEYSALSAKEKAALDAGTHPLCIQRHENWKAAIAAAAAAQPDPPTPEEALAQAQEALAQAQALVAAYEAQKAADDQVKAAEQMIAAAMAANDAIEAQAVIKDG